MPTIFSGNLSEMASLGELARLRPELAHVTFQGGSQSIRRRGLQSVAALAAASTSTDEDTHRLLSSYRPDVLPLPFPEGEIVVLRDQLRRRRNIEASLHDMTEVEWLGVLNERVFLFPSRHKRVSELVDAYTAKGHAQEVMYLDTALLLQDHENVVEVATVNTGAFPHKSGPTRGRETFIPLERLPRSQLAKVQEVTVRGQLPVGNDCIRRIVNHLPTGASERLWPTTP
jgi:hypothetical protein